ncbi:MAG TPA: 5'-nucleotidase C-terminal domain-containing protein [Candidatus Thermoplasmatota archaeon]|nr:5'-nucleotidase C-terminal domain-containing protein [Candidatus Thermoplasmatota archaeon]
MSRTVVLTLVAIVVAAPMLAEAAPRPTVEIQLLSISDWHGQLDSFSVAGVGAVGGAAVIAAYWDAERARNPNTLAFTAGDAFGGTPPLSSFFGEEPAVLALNAMGLDADTLGNHNFDRGVAHLRSMMSLADYSVVAANLADPAGELPDVRRYVIKDVGGVKVGIVGVVNPEAPTLVKPGSFGQTYVTDPVQAAQQARAAAKQEGAKVFVLLAHMGVEGTDANGAPAGPLVDLAAAVGGFDVVLGDHTDRPYIAITDESIVVENPSKGRTYSRITLRVDPHNGRISDRQVDTITPLASAVTPDADVEALLAPYRSALAAAYDAQVGVASALFPRASNIERLQEVALGNLVADAMREAYGTQVALTNGGGLRAPIPSSYAPADATLRRTSPGYAAGPPFDVVLGDVYAVLPFGNVVVTRTVTGTQLIETLEHGVSSMPSANGRFLQVSGLRFTYDATLPVGARVLSVQLDDGTPVLRDATLYTLATSDFMNVGGDGYTMLADGRGTTRDLMAAVLAEHIAAAGTITPVVEGRITRVA